MSGYAPPPPPPQQPQNFGPQTISNNKALISMILGITVFCFGILTGIPALILGYMGLQEAERLGGTGKGQAIAGLILGGLSVVSTAVFVLLFVGSSV